jgi:hypothetical protein
MRFATNLLFAGSLLGCGAGTRQAPSFNLTDLPAEVTLEVGESRTVGSAVVHFAGVANDSRCPSDVTCVWAGNAEVQLVVSPAAGEGPSHQVLLNTGIDPRSGGALGLTLTLLDLTPTPVSTQPTKGYHAVIRIDRGS